MNGGPLAHVNTLAFDLFGTVLDLTGTIAPALGELFDERGIGMDPQQFWREWRARQRIEQHQDTILMLGHSGYIETARRAFVYTLRSHAIEMGPEATRDFMGVFARLKPFRDAGSGLARLGGRFSLVALSNGNQWLLDELIERTGLPFDARVSVERFGNFKPHPSVYRGAAGVLEREPGEILMTAAHSFDILGARACGYRGAYVNRYRLPYDDRNLQPDLIVTDFDELADRLGCE